MRAKICPFFDRRVEIDVDFLKASRDLGADLHRHQRRQRSARRDLGHDAAALDRAGLELRARLFLSGEQAITDDHERERRDPAASVNQTRR